MFNLFKRTIYKSGKIRIVKVRNIKHNKYGPTNFNDKIETVTLAQGRKLPADYTVSCRNANILVLGPAGSGKTRCFVEPTLKMREHNYIVHDPEGYFYDKYKEEYLNAGYTVKFLDLTDPKNEESNHFNPLHYINDARDAMYFAKSLFENDSADKFWGECSTHLLASIIICLKKTNLEATIAEVLQLLQKTGLDDNNPNSKSELDKMVESIAAEQQDVGSDEFALNNIYSCFAKAGKNTKREIVLNVSMKLSEAAMFAYADDLEFDKINTDKYILFVKTSSKYPAQNMASRMAFSILFEELELRTRRIKKCPHVQVILDDFVNIGKIRAFEVFIACCRKYNVSYVLVAQTCAQTEKLYEADAIASCDSHVFMGGDPYSVEDCLARFDERRKDFTIFDADQVKKLRDDECLVQIRGYKPQICKKLS